jgi:hypothetical protein
LLSGGLEIKNLTLSIVVFLYVGFGQESPVLSIVKDFLCQDKENEPI